MLRQSEPGPAINLGQALRDGYGGPLPDLGQDASQGPTDKVIPSQARGSEHRLEE